MNKKLISIIVNCHNGEKFLRECINSVINQTYKRWELIFWDNKSTDSSKKIFKSYNDKRLHYFYSNTKDKLYKARNKAIKKAKGSFLAFLDTDDFWIPKNLYLRKKFFKEKKYIFSYSNYFKFFEKSKNIKVAYNQKLPQNYIFKKLLQSENNFVALSSLIIRKSFLKKNKFQFDDRFDILGDYDLILKMSQNNLVHCKNTPSVYIRYHKKNLSRLKRSIFFNEYHSWLKKEKKQYSKYKFILEIRMKYLEIVSSLYKKKNFDLLKKILNYPILQKKLKLILFFFIPRRVLSFFNRHYDY